MAAASRRWSIAAILAMVDSEFNTPAAGGDVKRNTLSHRETMFGLLPCAGKGQPLHRMTLRIAFEPLSAEEPEIGR